MIPYFMWGVAIPGAGNSQYYHIQQHLAPSFPGFLLKIRDHKDKFGVLGTGNRPLLVEAEL